MASESQTVAVHLINVFLSIKRHLSFSEVCNLIKTRFNLTLNNSLLSKFLQRFPDNFEEYSDNNGQKFVRLITNVSICETHCSRNASCDGDADCTGLHICKFYLLQGKCRFGGICRFGHDLTTSHNSKLLRENLLSNVPIDALRYLLNLPENRTKATIPKICKFYNLAAGCRQNSSGSCPFLHICKFYLQGKCQFNKKCSRSHDINDSVKAILKRHGIDTAKPITELLSELKILYSDGEGDEDADSLSGVQAEVPARWASQPVLSQASRMKSLSLGPDKFSHQQEAVSVPVGKKMPRTMSTLELGNTRELVCLYHLRGKCAFGKSCRNYHGSLPYQWQYKLDGEDIWDDVESQENWQLELTYCDAKNSKAYVPLSGNSCMEINFSTMTGVVKTGEKYEVRRLSTLSSEETKGEPLATDWIWYWIDNLNAWIQYGAGTTAVKHAYSSTITSDDIEKVYLGNPEGQMRFCTEGHEYVLDFSKMVQVNIKIGTERPVRRRPVFVKELAQMKGRLKGHTLGAQSDTASGGNASVPYPPDWDMQRGRDIRDHFSLTKISKRCNTREYSKVESLFFETMPNTATIMSIERVENGELWTAYCFKKDRMQKKNPKKSVDERQLFHGTRPEYVDAICRQNFDFRLSGQTSGTRYGKGSYFALTAKYSDCYTDPSNKMMFVVKVLVGEYKQGQSKFVRPPSKDESNKSSDLFDSCVDDEKNPKVFVIFDLYQVYPEFVIKYDIKAPNYF